MARHGGEHLLILLAVLALIACADPTPEDDGLPSPVATIAPPSEPNPGAEVRPEDLTRALGEAWAARPEDYTPRTRHLVDPAGREPQFLNRLFLQTSPYLLQHAHNPVDWYPWGDEAFEAARRLNRPVFLSVGYSTCHWCHVMEEESFEDLEIAEYLNANFICIKVDREERPDVDSVYMTAVHALRGRGGWPMTVFLTPDREPFYAGTYFPPRDGARGDRPGFLTILREIRKGWADDRSNIDSTAARLAAHIQQRLGPQDVQPIGTIDASVMRRAVLAVGSGFDDEWGGMSRRSKFPSNTPVRFLLREHRRSGDTGARRMAHLTLTKMAAGGMNDQVGGGFHRYATDERWLVPHFEKMLYDNALLAVAYLEGWQATGDASYADTARAVLQYVEREMVAPGGAFYSATDADSPNPAGEREEGWFFTWTPDEVTAVLDPGAAALATAVWGLTPRGNFEHRNIPWLERPLHETAKQLGRPTEDVQAELVAIKEALYVARAKRPPPLLDDKILTAWNGLMISAFATAARDLAEPRYALVAGRAAVFLLTNLRRAGTLHRAWKDGQVGALGILDDHAFLCAGLLDLFEATGEVRWLDEAIALDAQLRRRFADPRGGWFLTASDGEKLLAREKPISDGAEPSGNSVHVLNLLRLSELTTDPSYRVRADAAMKAVEGTLTRAPIQLSEMLLGVDWTLDRPIEVAIIAPTGGRAAAAAFERELGRRFLPNKVAVVLEEGPALVAASERVPWLSGKKARGGQVTAYVCEAGICELPADTAQDFGDQLDGRRHAGASAPQPD